jgi:hypothetical protein
MLGFAPWIGEVSVTGRRDGDGCCGFLFEIRAYIQLALALGGREWPAQPTEGGGSTDVRDGYSSLARTPC